MTGGRPKLISLRTTGGVAAFPRAAAGWSIDPDELSEADLGAVRAAISAADFFVRPAAKSSPDVRDGRTHRLHIDLDGRSRSLDIPDPFTDQTLADLVHLIHSIVTR